LGEDAFRGMGGATSRNAQRVARQAAPVALLLRCAGASHFRCGCHRQFAIIAPLLGTSTSILACGASGRVAGAVFYNAHLSNELSRIDRAENYRVPIEVPEYFDGTPKQAKNAVRRISLSEEDLPFGKVQAIHCGRPRRQTVPAVERYRHP
jgi:hypothetical protein